MDADTVRRYLKTVAIATFLVSLLPLKQLDGGKLLDTVVERVFGPLGGKASGAEAEEGNAIAAATSKGAHWSRLREQLSYCTAATLLGGLSGVGILGAWSWLRHT